MRYFIIALIWLAPIIMGSCNPHGSTVIPQREIPNHFNFHYSKKIDKIVPTFNWWENFHSPSLNKAMEIAFEKNLDIKMAFYRLKQAEAINQKSRSSLWPSLEMQASGSRTHYPEGNSDLYKIGLAASYEIDLWKKLSSYRESSQWEKAASQADLETAYLTVSALVAEDFFKMVALKEQIKVTNHLIDSFYKILKLVETRYASGVVTSADLYQAKQNLLGVKARLPLLQSNLEAAKNSLAFLLGSAKPNPILEQAASLPEPDFSFETGLPSDLLLNRPDIKASLLRLKKLDAKVAQAVAEKFPVFNLGGTIWYEEQELSKLFDFKNLLWSIMASISQSIFDAGKRKAEVNFRKAQLEEGLADYRKKVLKGFQEVRDSFAALDSAEQHYAFSLKRLQVAESSLKLAIEQYSSGISTFLPVLEAESAYSQAQLDLIEAKRLRILGRIQLARALGGSWMNAQTQRTEEKDE